MIPERPVTISPDSGPALEAALALPADAGVGVVVCHPHPRYGGDMDSPVVVTAAAACAGRGLATLRFNFRGVGGSGGAWDEGRGEREDVRAALAYMRARLAPPARTALAGYSFGALMAGTVAAMGEPLAGLALIAPPLATARMPAGPVAVDGPTLVVAGSDDSHCPREALSSLATSLPAATVTMIDGSDHFFFAGLDALEAALAAWAGKVAG
jgi:alpha/beta superfamily hydrolase